MSDEEQRCWEVHLWWKDARGCCESGANTSFPASMGPMEVIAEVARWRGVDLSRCHDVSAVVMGGVD
jgi:hypothetical protein